MANTELDDLIARVDEWPVGSAAVGVLHADATTIHGPAENPFALASVSKLLTAYAVMLAVEEGAIELDEPVDVSGLEDFQKVPTVRQLLAHAGGVAFGERTQQKAPETRRIYSSAGYEMLAENVERATGMSFEEYCQMGLNDTLGMSVDFSGSAGHGFTGSVEDLVAFAGEVLHPRLLDESTVAEMLTVQYPDLNGIVPGYGMQKPCPWGLGFEVRGSKGGDADSHEGDGGGHWLVASMPKDVAGHFGQSGTFVWVAREQGLAAVVLTDRDFGEWAKPLWSEFNADLWAALE